MSMIGPPRSERGQVAVLFGLMLPVFMGLGAIVIGVGNWYTHGKHLQTKADAAALAGGSVWGFPCGSDINANIETQARTFVGPHTQADGAVFGGTTFNPQVGGVDETKIHAILNGNDWYDDDSNQFQADRNDPVGPLCEASILDVKATEDNSFPLFSLLPLFPDIKRKARVEIREVEGLTGLLPLGVRFPKPVSSAAIFYDEANNNILSVRYFQDGAVAGLPSELRGLTTFNSAQGAASWASFVIPNSGKIGVVVATSFRPACDTDAPPGIPTDSAPCFEDEGFTNVNDLCRQGARGVVQCFWTTGSGSTQTVQSGLHFIRGYPTAPNTGTGPPELRTAFLRNMDCPATSYFNALLSTCRVQLELELDLGALLGDYPNPSPPPPDVTEQLKAGDVEVRYRLVRADGTSFCNYGVTCDLNRADADDDGTVTFMTTGAPDQPHLPITAGSRGNAVAIQVRVRNAQNSPNDACKGDFNDNCRWFYTGNGVFGTSVAPTNAQILAAPIQRSFMGDTGDNTPISGPVKFLQLTVDDDVDGDGNCEGTPDMIDLDAASQPIGERRCFLVDMGLRGGIAQDQDEPPVVFNLGSSSQTALIDCDPDIPSLRREIELGCSPYFKSNDFTLDPPCPAVSGANQFFYNAPAPFDALWPPYTCVLTQTGSAPPGQIISGFRDRLFPGAGPGASCPSESGGQFTPGRNYWHDANNPSGPAYTFAEKIPIDVHGNNLGVAGRDPRLITLFMTSYDSFGGSGNATYPIIAFGTFYVTGYSGPGGSDPCTDGNTDPSPGAGSKPPPDLNPVSGSAYVWGHFVNNVVPSTEATPSDVLCAPTVSTNPCIPVLVE